MRKIKFRAWDKEKKVMVYDNDTDWRDTYPVSVTNKGIIFCDKGRWGTENEVKDEDGNVGYKQWEYDKYYQNVELMQFTGTMDSNLKEIYEGDLLILNGDKLAMFEVFYHDDEARFKCCRTHYAGNRCGGYVPDMTSKNLTVIGNIYENKDLL